MANSFGLRLAIQGYSKDIPTQPSLFEELKLDEKISHVFGDIDYNALSEVFNNFQPDFVFHLANC